MTHPDPRPSITRRARWWFDLRGETRKLPLLFAVSLAISTVLDLASMVMVGGPEAVGQRMLASDLLGRVIAPRAIAGALIVVLAILYLFGVHSDERAATRPRPEPADARTSWQATAAAWIAMIAGVGFGVYALYIVSLLWSSADQYRATGNDDAGLIEPLLIAIALIGLVIAAAPVWLGGLVLRRRRWARYALLAFGLLAAWGAGAWVFTRAFAFALWVIPLLLIWAELRSRDLVPPFRRNWRGYVLLSVNAAMFFGLALFAALDSPVVEAATGSDLSTGSAMMGVGSIVWFALGVPAAMWAINRDSEPLLSGLNGRLVVWAPALISFVGLVMAVASVVGGQGADWLS